MANELTVNGPDEASVNPDDAAVAATKVRQPRSYAGIIGNCNKFNSKVETFGISYTPTNSRTLLASLRLTTTGITKDHTDVIDLVLPNKSAIIACNDAFKIMKPYKTGILNTLKSSENASKAEILISTNLGKKVDGIRIKPIKITPPTTSSVDEEAELDTIKHNSVSHQQMAILILAFYEFFTYSIGLASYNTTETNMMMPAVKAYYDSLTPLMNNSQKTSGDINIARQKRKVSFFDESVGAVHSYNQAKKYILSKYGSKSNEYKSVKGIAFYDLRTKKER